MKLGEKQELFARCFSRLIEEANDHGYEVRIKEVLRGREQAQWNGDHCARRLKVSVRGWKRCERTRAEHSPDEHVFKSIGIKGSLHLVGLAGDIVLSKDGSVTWTDDEYEVLGQFWEALHALCCWGGRFGDGGHFSITHGGKK